MSKRQAVDTVLRFLRARNVKFGCTFTVRQHYFIPLGHVENPVGAVEIQVKR